MHRLGFLMLILGLVSGIVAFGSSRNASAAQLEQRGMALFSAKGCTSCHVHSRIHGSGRIGIGPELSNWHGDPAFLVRWLADPQAIRPGTGMPNLHLTDDEIDALVAFLTAVQ